MAIYYFVFRQCIIEIQVKNGGTWCSAEILIKRGLTLGAKPGPFVREKGKRKALHLQRETDVYFVRKTLTSFIMYMHVAGVIHSLAWIPQLKKNNFFETDFWDWIYKKKPKKTTSVNHFLIKSVKTLPLYYAYKAQSGVNVINLFHFNGHTFIASCSLPS